MPDVAHVIDSSMYPGRSISLASSCAHIGIALTVPHQVYAQLLRKCDFMHRQNQELRRLSDQRSMGLAIEEGKQGQSLVRNFFSTYCRMDSYQCSD